MSLRLTSRITITQQPTTNYPNRNKVFILNFVNSLEINSSWKNLTDTCKLVIPKNLYVKTSETKQSFLSMDAYMNTVTEPLFLRGDKISIRLGYYYNPTGKQYIDSIDDPTIPDEFTGFISKVNPKIPMEIYCENNTWLLKQAQCPNKVFQQGELARYDKNSKNKTAGTLIDGNTWNTENILKYLLVSSSTSSTNNYLNKTLIPTLATFNVVNGFGKSESIKTHIGTFRTMNETIAQVLDRFRKDYKLECFFRGNDLYASGVVYNPDLYVKDGKIITTVYDFQNNIISDDMQYLRKDDLRLGIKAYSVLKQELTSVNNSGGKKTQHKRLEVIVGDSDGDIRTQFFWPENSNDPNLTTENLTELAKQRLNKLKFDGWHGSFVSFGLPYLQHGMAVTLKDNIIKERSGGTYLVKSVRTTFGVDTGFRREIELHLRINYIGTDGKPTFSFSDYLNGL